MAEQKDVILLVGKSGTGKTYLADVLRLNRAVSMTTRARRPGEIDGIDYHFVTSDDIAALAPDTIISERNINGTRYAITREQVERGDVVIVDPAGVDDFKKQGIFRCRVVLVHAPLYRRVIRMIHRECRGHYAIRTLRTAIPAACSRVMIDRRLFQSVTADYIIRT